MNTTGQRYRIPTASTHAVISLDEFSREEIEQYLEHLRGNEQGGTPTAGLELDGDELDRITTLLLCGQRDAAREYVFDLISRHIGRSL